MFRAAERECVEDEARAGLRWIRYSTFVLWYVTACNVRWARQRKRQMLVPKCLFGNNYERSEVGEGEEKPERPSLADCRNIFPVIFVLFQSHFISIVVFEGCQLFANYLSKVSLCSASSFMFAG